MEHASVYWPPEWAPQAAIWVGWPRLLEEWGKAFEPARVEIAAVIRALSHVTPVRVAVGDEAAEASARMHLGPTADLRRVPTGDIWLRDTGPLFLSNRGIPSAALFHFNGWGEKFDMAGDKETNAAIAEAEAAAPVQNDFILEGGAIETDGAGRVLTTRACLLNPNRNRGWSEADAEAALQAALGARQVIWLEDGLLNDHTDGHVDNVARFIGPGRVVCQQASDPDDPNRDRMLEVYESLKVAGLDVATIPASRPVFDESGAVLPVCHMNFVLSNGLCIVPQYDEASSAAACAALSALLPGYQVRALPSHHILAGGGSFHCMTCHVPAITEERADD